MMRMLAPDTDAILTAICNRISGDENGANARDLRTEIKKAVQRRNVRLCDSAECELKGPNLSTLYAVDFEGEVC